MLSNQDELEQINAKKPVKENSLDEAKKDLGFWQNALNELKTKKRFSLEERLASKLSEMQQHIDEKVRQQKKEEQDIDNLDLELRQLRTDSLPACRKRFRDLALLYRTHYPNDFKQFRYFVKFHCEENGEEASREEAEAGQHPRLVRQGSRTIRGRVIKRQEDYVSVELEHFKEVFDNYGHTAANIVDRFLSDYAKNLAPNPLIGDSTESEPKIRFIAIGCPGHGKSFWLNSFAGKEDLFLVAPAGCRGTQAGDEKWEQRNVKELTVEDADLGRTYSFVLQDAPGFPDPNIEDAAKYYDCVVSKCCEPLNGVVFVIKPERLLDDVIFRYKTLLREFIKLKAPLYMIVNGTESAKRPNQTTESYQKKRQDGKAAFRRIAQVICEEVGLVPREIFVSYTEEELDGFRLDLARLLAAGEAHRSNLKSFEDLRKELAEAEKKPEVMLQQELEQQRNILTRLNAEMEYHEEQVKAYTNMSAEDNDVAEVYEARKQKYRSEVRLSELDPAIAATRGQIEKLEGEAESKNQLKDRVSKLAKLLCPDLL